MRAICRGLWRGLAHGLARAVSCALNHAISGAVNRAISCVLLIGLARRERESVVVSGSSSEGEGHVLLCLKIEVASIELWARGHPGS